MFNFKKNKPLLNQADITAVLEQYLINRIPVSQFLTKSDTNGTILNLDLRLPDDCNPEQIHHELSQKLHLLGVSEINMNITLFKAEILKAQKGNSKTLPKITDAMITQQAIIDESVGESPNQSRTEPPITKKATAQSELTPHPRIKHIIVVASGKGGVGKSTTTVNIALALQKLGKRVGVLDADIYGPSIPTMLGVAGIHPELENEQFVPIEAYAMPLLSIGSLLDGDSTPVAWRGAKATGALMQLYNQTNWPQLDYLVIDMPPGTGDIQLTLAQRIPVTGAVIVTTPQHIALLDAQKGIEMFNKTQIPVLGVVENMALHTCSNCGHSEAIFGEGGGSDMAQRYHIPLLGQLPLAKGIREQADKGEPSVLVDDEFAKFYLTIAKNIEHHIGKFTKVSEDKRIF